MAIRAVLPAAAPGFEMIEQRLTATSAYFSAHAERVVDFGNSMTPDSRKVSEKILERLPATISLSALSLLIGFALAIPIGILSAARRNGWFDTISSTFLYVLYAIPNYVIKKIKRRQKLNNI